MAEAGAPWQLALEKVEQRCGYLFTSGLWSDCSFVVGLEANQAVVPAHKLVLAMASPVFEAMFFGELKECDHSVVSIPDVQPEAFRALLQYVYTGNITIVSFDMAWDIWYGAKKYMLPHLATECNKYICSVLCPTNACRAYELANFFDEKPLIDECLKIISKNTKAVVNDSSFEHLDINTVIKVFSLDHLNVDTELDLYHALARYAKAEHRTQGQNSPLESGEGGAPSKNLEDSTSTSEEKNVDSSFRTSPAVELDSKTPSEVVTPEQTSAKENLKEEEPTIRTALEKIRFLTLTAQQFGEGPAASGLLTKAESFAVFMNIVCKASAEQMPSGFSECRERRTSDMAIALCSHSAGATDELSYEQDDIINVIRESSEYVGWWTGELRGTIGLFLSKNVKKL